MQRAPGRMFLTRLLVRGACYLDGPVAEPDCYARAPARTLDPFALTHDRHAPRVRARRADHADVAAVRARDRKLPRPDVGDHRRLPPLLRPSLLPDQPSVPARPRRARHERDAERAALVGELASPAPQ